MRNQLTIVTLLLVLIVGLNSSTVEANEDASPTPEQLEECKELGIPSYQCSEQKILGKKCLGMHCNTAPQTNENYLLNTNMLLYWSILASAFGGLAMVFIVKSRRKNNVTFQS